MLVLIIYFLGIPALGIVALSPLLALTIYISFRISKSGLKVKKYYGYINTGFWLFSLVCFWCFIGWYMSILTNAGEYKSAATSGQLLLPFSGSFIFNAIASFLSYKSFLRRLNPKSIITLNNVIQSQNIQPNDDLAGTKK